MRRVTDNAAGEYTLAKWIGPDYSAAIDFDSHAKGLTPLWHLRN